MCWGIAVLLLAAYRPMMNDYTPLRCKNLVVRLTDSHLPLDQTPTNSWDLVFPTTEQLDHTVSTRTWNPRTWNPGTWNPPIYSPATEHVMTITVNYQGPIVSYILICDQVTDVILSASSKLRMLLVLLWADASRALVIRLRLPHLVRAFILHDSKYCLKHC
jgi:hypothetical protein